MQSKIIFHTIIKNLRFLFFTISIVFIFLLGIEPLPAQETGTNSESGIESPQKSSGDENEEFTESFDENSENDDVPLRLSVIGQEISVLFPGPQPYGLGIGGALVYETYLLDHLIFKSKYAKGIFMGLIFNLFILNPQHDASDKFSNLTIIQLGLNLGYQLSFSLTNDIQYSPGLHIGGQFYRSYHYYDGKSTPVIYPIVLAGTAHKIIFNNLLVLSLKFEYKLFIEKNSLNSSFRLALGTSLLF